MAATGIKFDDGIPGFALNCFPVRSLLRQQDDDDGAWLVAHRAEQRRRFKAVLCAKPKSYSQIKEERRRAEHNKEFITFDEPTSLPAEEAVNIDEEKVLDGFFLMKHCCVDDPSDLCSVGINGLGLSEVKVDDFALFDNVAYVNASENYLPLEAFRGFPIIRELEMTLNGLRGIKIEVGDFPKLEILDLSCNNLSKDDILPLGLLPNLKVLHLTGNGLRTLPPDLSKAHVVDGAKKQSRFPSLEILMLDDNRLSNLTTFASLAGLRSLKVLNLSKNEIYSVPQLQVAEGKRPAEDSTRKTRKTPDRLQKEGSDHLGGTDPPPTSAEVEDSSVGIEGLSFEKSTLDPIPEGPKDADDLDVLDENLSQALGALEEEEEDIPPPFSDLRSIDLSYNKIAEEEALLAVAAWPMLAELIVHNNPLTIQRSGDPPLLKRFLKERLGIDVVRKKQENIEKPHIQVPPVPSRKVKAVVPKVPKVTVDELLAIEAAKPAPKTSSSRSSRSSKSERPASMTSCKPLPPITPTEKSSLSDGDEVTEEESKKSTPQEAWNDEDVKKYDGEAFFMTQVNEGGAQENQEEEKTESPVPRPPSDRKEKKTRRRRERVPSRYKGYEVMLDAETDPDVTLPKDMQGSIRALQYTLNHPLMFRDPRSRLDLPQPNFVPYQKPRPTATVVAKSKSQKVQEVLDTVKNRQVVVDASLTEAITRDDYKKEFPEAEKLLNQIQSKYTSVRLDSLKDAREIRHLVKATVGGAKPGRQAAKKVQVSPVK